VCIRHDDNAHTVNSPDSHKKSTTYASPVPYGDAVHILGSEEALRRSAGRLSRISNWKKRGVPAGIVLPALLLRFFEAEKRRDRNSQLAGSPLLELQAGRGRLDKLPQSYQERYEARLKEITARGQREAKEFLALLEAEYRSDRSKPRGKAR
jgi:hypothetical protein